MKQLDSENADRDLTSLVTVLTHTPSATVPMRCQALIQFGDGTKNLDGTGGDFEVVITVGGQTLEPSPQVVTFSTAVRAQVFTAEFPVPANAEVVVKALSPNAADTDVDVTAVIYDVESVTLADDAIKASTFDESTAYPLKSADTGATAIARTGEDSDTLETLSDQIDGTAQTSALPANFSSLAIDTDGCVSADIIKIRGNELAAKILAARNYAYMDDQVVTVELEADDTDAQKFAKFKTAYAAAKALTPGGNALSATNRAKVKFPESHYYTGDEEFTFDGNYVDLCAIRPMSGGHRLPTDHDMADGTTSLATFRPSPTLFYTDVAGKDTLRQSATDVRMTGFSVAQLSGSGSGSYHGLNVTCEDNSPSGYDLMYFWHKAPYSDTSTTRYPIAFAKHCKGLWTGCIANAYAWRIGYDAENEGVFSATMFDCEAGPFSFIGDYPSGRKGTHKATGCYLRRCRAVGTTTFTVYQSENYSGMSSFSGCATWANDIDDTCVFIECEAGQNSFGLGANCNGRFYRCRGGNDSFGGTVSPYLGSFRGYAEDCIGGKGSFGGRSGNYNGLLNGTLVRCVALRSNYSWRLGYDALIVDTVLGTTAGSGQTNIDCLMLTASGARISGSTLRATGSGYAINAETVYTYYGSRNTLFGAVASYLTNLGQEHSQTLTAAYDPAKTAAQASALTTLQNNVTDILADTGELQTNQGNWLTATGFATPSDLTTLQSHGDSTWATATGFSTHAASDVVTALGTGSTLTACATADVSGIPAAVKVAMEAAGGTLASIVEDTGTTLPAAIANKAGYSLSADGLDAIPDVEPDGVPTNFIGWVRWYIQTLRNSRMSASKLEVLNNSGQPVTEQELSDDGSTQAIGPPREPVA